MTESVTEKIQKLKQILQYEEHKEKYPVCAVADLDALKSSQQVAWLPEVYEQLMLTGIIRVLDANVTSRGLINFRIKENLLEYLDEENLSYPQDLFAFYEHNNGAEIMFFRTKECVSDPPVYGYRGEGYFEKLADSLSELVHGTIVRYARMYNPQASEQNEPMPDATQREGYGHDTDYYYDSATDDFYGTPSPSYDGPVSTDALIEMLRVKSTPKSVKYGEVLTGCTEAEIEELQHAQHVDCLPEVYRQLMLLMGKVGIDWTFDGHNGGRYDKLKDGHAKELLISDLKRIGTSYPEDIFVFFMVNKMSFYFFRTRGCENDPVVFTYDDDFYKLADSLSQFLLRSLDPSISREYERLGRAYHQKYDFSVECDSFLPRAKSE